MKRLIAILLLICTLTLCLVSCDSDENNNADNTYVPPEKTATEKTTDLINAITDTDSCYEAAKAFYALTEEEQKNVSNANNLKTKMETYASDTRIRDYLMKAEAKEESQYFHNRLRNKLLNIDSYTVNEQTTVVFYDAKTENYYLYIKIDYSAQNKMGGYTRYENNADYYVWKNTNWSTLPFSSDEDIQLVKNIYTWQFEEYTRYYFTYTAN